jgi:peptide-methionine (R)-S-oxide reductase
LALYSSEDKVHGGRKWPIFHRNLPDAVATKPDNTWFTKRDEVHCRRCGSHLGHVFYNDAEPTGMRHQLNGISLKFITASEADYILHRSSSRVIRV